MHRQPMVSAIIELKRSIHELGVQGVLSELIWTASLRSAAIQKWDYCFTENALGFFSSPWPIMSISIFSSTLASKNTIQ